MNDLEHEKKTNTISTISKVLQVLECFSITEPELSAVQIAEKLDLPTSTLYRYLQTMVAEGFLQHDRATNLYAVGMHIVELAGIALTRYEVRRLGQQDLNELEQELNLNTNLGVLYQGDLFHLAFSTNLSNEPWHTIIGRRVPAHLTAMGKILLAYEPFEQVKQNILKSGWRSQTANSIHDFDVLERELKDARQHQFATDRQEYAGNCCLACPIRQRDGAVIAAISATSPPDRFYEELDTIHTAVFGAAARLSYKLGYLGNGYITNMS